MFTPERKTFRWVQNLTLRYFYAYLLTWFESVQGIQSPSSEKHHQLLHLSCLGLVMRASMCMLKVCSHT